MKMHSIWSKRFAHYIGELQKYMQYIFTGHIAVVLVFVLGALAYQYSEWLKTADTSFPTAALLAIVIGFVISLSKPTTLLREPDQVYLLPLESHMKDYFSKALKWTFFSQVLLPVVLFIVAIPLLRATTELTVSQVWLGLGIIVVLKIINVLTEFSYRYANRGAAVILDRLVRIIMNGVAIYFFVKQEFVFTGIFALMLVYYFVTIRKKVFVDPVPYEHFVKIEQNRMYRFYRFANYFTDVPHLRGSVKRRALLDFIYKFIPYNKTNAQRYLVTRTFIRTDDLFFLFVRLVLITAVFAAFIQIQFVTWLVSAALMFAMVLQLKQALRSSNEFRMDLLFPIANHARKQAINRLISRLIIIQTIIVTLCNIMMPTFYITAVISIFVGFMTLKISK